MARPTRRLIQALHVTIERLEQGAKYQWGHMGCCNCGHLAQSLTDKDRGEIHAAALRRSGDWYEQSVEYCATSNLPLDHIITTMLEAGLELHDINHLERLNDPDVLARLPKERKWLRRNSREDAVFYMKEWCALLEDHLAAAGDKLIDFEPEPGTRTLPAPREQVA
ncbi:MAG: hypothetical protein AAGI01_04430 [Myxococcota bacterium]